MALTSAFTIAGKRFVEVVAIPVIAVAWLLPAIAGEILDCKNGYDALLADVLQLNYVPRWNRSIIRYGDYAFTKPPHAAHPSVFYTDRKTGQEEGCGFGDRDAFKEALEDAAKRWQCPPCDAYDPFHMCVCWAF